MDDDGVDIGSRIPIKVRIDGEDHHDDAAAMEEAPGPDI